jgi:hypothetical protein
MRGVMEFEEATGIYRRTLRERDSLYRLTPPLPSPALSHYDEEFWYLRDGEGRLIARVGRLGIVLP